MFFKIYLFISCVRDGNGEMDIAEFANLLNDLGVECSQERLDAAFAQFDSNRDGVLSFFEFSSFWRRDEVSYTLKRSEPIRPLQTKSVTSASTASVVSRGSVITSKQLTGNTANAPMTPGRSSTAEALSKKPYKDVPTPVTSYRAGPDRSYEEKGLLSNTLYHFKIRYVGARVNSLLSAPLIIMTAPAVPAAPVLLRVTSTSLKIKWYAPARGAMKFEVQLQSSSNMEWINVYCGQENVWMSTTMAPDCAYKVRVLAINYQGASSEPSAAVSFKTPPRSELKEVLTPRNVESSFTIECIEDICVGDIILISERLFAKEKNRRFDLDDKGGINAQPSVHSTDGKNVRMDLSVISYTGERPAPGSYIGERTIAAHVVRDNYRSYRDSVGTNQIDVRKFGKVRRLWLEVIWEQASTESCKQYKLNAGTVIERTQAHFEQFEVFRCPWQMEEQRLSFASEIESLVDCFMVPDI